MVRNWLEVGIEYIGKPSALFDYYNPDKTLDEKTGLCCSGLVLKVLEKSGFEIPNNFYTGERVRNSAQIREFMTTPLKLEEMLPGDILFFGSTKATVNHLGFYMGEKEGEKYILHSPGVDNNTIKIEKLSEIKHAKIVPKQRYCQRAIFGDSNPVAVGRISILDPKGNTPPRLFKLEEYFKEPVEFKPPTSN